jgi:hypothetical protein
LRRYYRAETRDDETANPTGARNGAGIFTFHERTRPNRRESGLSRLFNAGANARIRFKNWKPHAPNRSALKKFAGIRAISVKPFAFMKTNLIKSQRPGDRLEVAHASAAGVLIRDRRETQFIPFHRNATHRSPSPRFASEAKWGEGRGEVFPDRQFPEARRGRPLTLSVLPPEFKL